MKVIYLETYTKNLRQYLARASYANKRGLASSVCLLTVLFIGLSFSYKQNSKLIEYIDDNLPKLQQAITYTQANPDKLNSVLPALVIFSKINEAYNNKLNSWLLNFELYAPIYNRFQIEKAYQTFLNDIVFPKVLRYFESMLKQKIDKDELLYLYFKGYLAVSGNKKANPDWIMSPLIFELNANADSERVALLYYLKKALAYPISKTPVDPILLNDIRTRLYQLSFIDITY